MRLPHLYARHSNQRLIFSLLALANLQLSLKRVIGLKKATTQFDECYARQFNEYYAKRCFFVSRSD